MKKTGIIIAVVVVIVIGTVVAVPLFFKQNLIDAAKSTLNKYVQAEVEFADVDLTILKSFPKATLELKNVVIVGENEFKNDTLLQVSSARVTMSLSSLFKKTGINVEEITLDNPLLKLIVAGNGKTNWDLINGEETSKTESELLMAKAENPKGSDDSFVLQLDKIEISGGSFLYLDKEAEMEVGLTDINFDISGEMFGSTTELAAAGKVDKLNLRYNNVAYISNISLAMQTVLNVDYEKMRVSIAKNELLVNKLALELTGNMEFPSDSMFFDMRIKTRESDFENFLALVPPEYESYLKEVTTTGSASVSGSLSGFLFEENYPAFALKMRVADGNFHYADFPDQIKNIKADVAVSKPQGNLNLTTVKVNEAHAEIKNNPIDFTLQMNNLVADPWFDGAFVGKINFDHLKDVLPLDSVNIAGLIDANLFAKGNYSAIENEAYDGIKMDGIVLLDNFVYDSPELTEAVFVPGGQLDFSPRSINLSKFQVRVGQSDFNLSGKVSNYLNYFLKDGQLKGDMRLNSNFVNLNEMLRLQVAQPEAVQTTETTANPDARPPEEKEQEVLVFDIPANVDLTFRSHINNAVFDRVPISDINGLITAKAGKLILNGLNMQMLDGELNINGSYENTAQNQPLIDFGVDVRSFDIPTAYRSLSGIRSMIPVAGHSQGKFSTNVKMKGRLTPDLKFIASSINGGGQFSSKDLQIIESPIFNQLRGILKSEKLKNVAIEDFKANFVMKNGNIELKPFQTKVAGQETTLQGVLSVENLLNMRLDIDVQREAFGPDIQNILSMIPGNEKIKMLPAGVDIEGPVGNPEIKMDLSEASKIVLNATKDDLQNTLNKLGSGLKKLFK